MIAGCVLHMKRLKVLTASNMQVLRRHLMTLCAKEREVDPLFAKKWAMTTETFWLVLLLGPQDVVKLTFLTFLQTFKMLFASSILISSVNMVGNSSIMLTLTKNAVPGWKMIFKNMKNQMSA